MSFREGLAHRFLDGMYIVEWASHTAQLALILAVAMLLRVRGMIKIK